MYFFNSNSLSKSSSIKPKENSKEVTISENNNFNSINIEKNSIELSLNILSLDHKEYHKMTKQEFLVIYNEKIKYEENINNSLALNILLKNKLNKWDPIEQISNKNKENEKYEIEQMYKKNIPINISKVQKKNPTTYPNYLNIEVNNNFLKTDLPNNINNIFPTTINSLNEQNMNTNSINYNNNSNINSNINPNNNSNENINNNNFFNISVNTNNNEPTLKISLKDFLSTNKEIIYKKKQNNNNINNNLVNHNLINNNINKLDSSFSKDYDIHSLIETHKLKKNGLL